MPWASRRWGRGTWAQSRSVSELSDFIGGARRDRTADLLHAMQALSQLSYGPTRSRRTLRSRLRLVKVRSSGWAPVQHRVDSCQRPLPPKKLERGIDGGRDRCAGNRDPNRLRDFSESALQLTRKIIECGMKCGGVPQRQRREALAHLGQRLQRITAQVSCGRLGIDVDVIDEKEAA